MRAVKRFRHCRLSRRGDAVGFDTARLLRWRRGCALVSCAACHLSLSYNAVSVRVITAYDAASPRLFTILALYLGAGAIGHHHGRRSRSECGRRNAAMAWLYRASLFWGISRYE